MQLKMVLFLIALLCVSPRAQAQDCTEDAVIVFDGSGSMAEAGFNNIGGPRILDARRAMQKVIPKIARVRRLGLVTYGPGPEEQACTNVQTLQMPKWSDGTGIINEIQKLEPSGETPLTLAVLRAAQMLEYKTQPGTVVLVTDGHETCEGAPCQLAAALAAESKNLTVHVIGFKVRGRHFLWDGAESGYNAQSSPARCLADRTGGQYLGVEDINGLISALQVTLGCNVFGALKLMSEPS